MQVWAEAVGSGEPYYGQARASATIAEVRAWARKKGLPVGARGHLTEPLIRAYNRSHHRRAFSANPKTKVSKP